MRKILAVMMTVVLLAMACPVPVGGQEAVPPTVSARGAVLMECSTGRVLMAVNEKEHLAMASTTKIMTALLTLELGDPKEEITVTDEMVRVEGTAMGLRAGDTVNMESLAVGMLLPSGNDAAMAAAITLGGSLEGFAQLMNERAQEIGCEDTNFVTPSGLDAEEHYSCAYDMALIAREAMKNPTFASIASSKTAKATFGNPPQERTLSNHNRLLRMYDGAIGVKTGFTKKAGRCLVSCAERDGVRLIAVTLNDGNDWKDHGAMFDYGFSLLSTQSLPPVPDITLPVVGGNEQSQLLRVVAQDVPSATLLPDEFDQLERTIQLPRFVYAPVKVGDLLGKAVYTLNGQPVAQTDLIAAEGVEYEPPKSAWEKFCGFWQWIWDGIAGLFS
ncbi:hypothetical protein C12CBH8_07160 [Solibaculum mannosilyticum]|uniref:serine-type D-Ala-D-Ala carboxypeptidase n=1 Tax=Solibaculum mannosilyticum TaxID=2780922 RepID=A0A7I8CZZ9_9FIRM|nr:D-alanyl-D-alanine carboxypeptidase family protein [Solibaculum mannosilyticum]BCI60077.1 hypothetical protein C12CBH8_07160 [Solibaculum mannosilyticum]